MIKEAEAEALSAALYVPPCSLSGVRLRLPYAEDLVLQSLVSQVATQRPPQPVHQDRTQSLSPRETNRRNRSKRKQIRRNVAYERLRRRPGRKRSG